MINCEVCNKRIVKYKLDIGNTVCILVEDKEIYICETCSYDIALERLKS